MLISELPFGSEFPVAKNEKGFVDPLLLLISRKKEEDLFLRGSRAFLSS